MNSKRRIFILCLLLITGSSAFLFAKARLERGTHYLISSNRGQITANMHNPHQGRITLTEVDSNVAHFPIRGEATKIETRSFFASWPEFDPRASMTFISDKNEMHLELTLSKPYYDRAKQLMTFDIESKSSLTPFHEIYDVKLYIHE